MKLSKKDELIDKKILKWSKNIFWKIICFFVFIIVIAVAIAYCNYTHLDFWRPSIVWGILKLLGTIISTVATLFVGFIGYLNAKKATEIQQTTSYETRKHNYEAVLPFFKVTLLGRCDFSNGYNEKEQEVVNFLNGFHKVSLSSDNKDYKSPGYLFELRNVSDHPALLVQLVCGEKQNSNGDQSKYKLRDSSTPCFSKIRLERFDKDGGNDDCLLFFFTEKDIKKYSEISHGKSVFRIGLYYLILTGERIKVTYEIYFGPTAASVFNKIGDVESQSRMYKFLGTKFINTNWDVYENREGKASYNYTDFIKRGIDSADQKERETYVDKNYNFADLSEYMPFRYE